FILLVVYQWTLNTYFPPMEATEVSAVGASAEPTTPPPMDPVVNKESVVGKESMVPVQNPVGKGPAQTVANPDVVKLPQIQSAQVVEFQNQKIQGGIALMGGELVDWRFLDYKDRVGAEGDDNGQKCTPIHNWGILSRQE
ncbi:MAG: hypothetical protein H7833_21130, partial [Magnetococcus sp. DMHC-1]